MKTVVSDIEEVCQQAFKDNDINFSKFNKEILCFNKASNKCSIVYNMRKDARLDMSFIIVCLGKNIKEEWKLRMFEVRNYYKGIDAMRLAHNFLMGRYG